ncbi:MAG TPA: glycosyltransferase, partial [Phototrophicaceae bacterium]|nr:glycosyltransferase [Phototrophicaceae bacterium]
MTDRVAAGDAPPTGPPRPLTTQTVVADHARYNRTAYRLAPTLLRSRSVSGRAILAHVASEGTVSVEELETLAHREDRERIVQALEPRSAGAYARVLAHQPGTGGEHAAAADLLGALVTAYGPDALVRRDLNLYGQLLAVLRRHDELDRLLQAGRDRADGTGMTRDVEAALVADLANPFLGHGAGGPDFLERFNAAIDPSATTGPVVLRPDGQTPFDRLAAATVDDVTGPLITVVTSAYNPDHALLGAARSLISQTWTNWEMLVVDDASTDPAARALLRDVERIDPRVRVIRKAVNGGTYRARNTALMQARGAFMTFLDSDDWAHPRRLEEGVRPMLEHPRIMATRSHGVRVTESLELTRPGYRTFFS